VLQLSADEVARNGAPLKINFGQRFSWTPLAFSFYSDFKLADEKPSPRALPLRQRKSLSDVQSSLPQQSRNYRLFEA
jgi:hypothetical protein